MIFFSVNIVSQREQREDLLLTALSRDTVTMLNSAHWATSMLISYTLIGLNEILCSVIVALTDKNHTVQFVSLRSRCTKDLNSLIRSVPGD